MTTKQTLSLLEDVEKQFDELASVSVTLVCGPDSCGKTTYIAETYGTHFYELIDIKSFDEKQTYPDQWSDYRINKVSNALFQSYIQERIHDLKERLKLSVLSTSYSFKDTDNIIIEMPGTTQEERREVIHTIKEILSENDIFKCIWVAPQPFDYANRIDRIDFDPAQQYRHAINIQKKCQLPTINEGFDQVNIVDFPTHTLTDITLQLVSKWKRRDIVWEKDLLSRHGHGIVQDNRIRDFKGRVVSQDKYNHSMEELWEATRLLNLYVNEIVPQMEMENGKI